PRAGTVAPGTGSGKRDTWKIRWRHACVPGRARGRSQPDARHLSRSPHARGRRAAAARRRAGAAGAGVADRPGHPLHRAERVERAAGRAGQGRHGPVLHLRVRAAVGVPGGVRGHVRRADAGQARAGAARGVGRRRAGRLAGLAGAQPAAHRGHAAGRLRLRPGGEPVRPARAAPGRHGRRHAGGARAAPARRAAAAAGRRARARAAAAAGGAGGGDRLRRTRRAAHARAPGGTGRDGRADHRRARPGRGDAAAGHRQLAAGTAMRQAHFVARHEREWEEFGRWLDARADSPRDARAARGWQGLRDEDMPARYRRLCQQLALALRRGYSPVVTARLQELMQRGHNALYRPASPRWRRALEFLVADFPRLVRAQRGCLWASAALFVASTVAMYLAVRWRPELVHSLFDPRQLAQFESMYDPAAPGARLGRDSGSDLAMFGFYIVNNVSIGFRTFASGLLAGVGSLAALVFNGVVFGAVAAHLQGIGHGDPFWRFVAGHSAPELSAIVVAGTAGLRLGLALVAPGRRSRRDALVESGKVGGKLCIGVFAMLLLAAFVEAFWSSIGSIPGPVKFAVGGALWVLVPGWLGWAGRGKDRGGRAR